MNKVFKKIAIILGIISFSFIFYSTSFAQVNELKLRVDGIACPFCAYGLEKKLKSLEGLESFDISIKKGTAELRFKEDNEIDISKIKVMVKDAGYTLKNIEMTASGYVEKEGNNFILNVAGNPNKLYIFEERHAKEKRPGEDKPVIMLSPNLKEKLTGASEDRIPIKITGMVHSHPDGSFGLSIEEYSIMEKKQ